MKKTKLSIKLNKKRTRKSGLKNNKNKAAFDEGFFSEASLNETKTVSYPDIGDNRSAKEPGADVRKDEKSVGGEKKENATVENENPNKSGFSESVKNAYCVESENKSCSINNKETDGNNDSGEEKAAKDIDCNKADVYEAGLEEKGEADNGKKSEIKPRAARFFAAAACLILLGYLMWTLLVSGLRFDRIYIDGEFCESGFTFNKTAGEALKLAEISFRKEDGIAEEEAEFSFFREISVTRAFSLNITADGKTVEVYALDGTVAEILSREGITLGEFDEVSPPLEEEIKPNTVITVKRVRYEERIAHETVPWREITKPSPLIKDGLERLMNREYRDGEADVTYRDRYVDGVLEGSERISERYTLYPYNAVTLKGDSSAPLSPIDGSKYTDVEIIDGVPSEYISVKERQPCTAYSFKPGVWGGSGMYLTQGMVAVNPDEYNWGQLLYITSADGSFVYGWAIVADAGEAMVDGRVEIDCFFETYKESALFGKHYMNVYVVDQLTREQLEEFVAKEGYFKARIPE